MLHVFRADSPTKSFSEMIIFLWVAVLSPCCSKNCVVIGKTESTYSSIAMDLMQIELGQDIRSCTNIFHGTEICDQFG